VFHKFFLPFSAFSFVCQSSNENENFEMNLTIPTVFTIYLILIQCLTDSSPMSTTTTNGQNFSEKFENSESGKKRFRCTSPLGSSDGSIVLESEDGEISGLTTLQVRFLQCFFLHFFLHYLRTEKISSKYILPLSCNRGTFYNIKIIGVKRKCHFQTFKSIFKVPLVVEWGIGWRKIWRLKNIKFHRVMQWLVNSLVLVKWIEKWHDVTLGWTIFENRERLEEAKK